MHELSSRHGRILMRPCIPKLPVPPIRKQQNDPLRGLAMKINPHQFMPQDPVAGLSNDEAKRPHDWLDPTNNNAPHNSGPQQAVRLKDERKRRVHLDSEHKRRAVLSEAMKSAAVAMGMEGVPQMILLQSINQTIIDLKQRRQELDLELRRRERMPIKPGPK